MSPEHRSTLVKKHALELGFDAVGITDLDPPPHVDELFAWLRNGMAASMHYMHRQAERRAKPALILKGATNAIVVTKHYHHTTPPSPGNAGRVAMYARGADYHHTLQGPLAQLTDYVRSLDGSETIAKYFVDAGPVPERELAQRAGLGWIGKNTMLIEPSRGSFCFLASVLTNLQLARDPPFEADRCGSCSRCLEVCPTNAFPQARVLDSRQCISYLTIEHHGEVPADLHSGLGDWVFGCDLCQDVCPWNRKFAKEVSTPVSGLDPRRAFIDLTELQALDEESFTEQFGWTPLERPGFDAMQRNARIVSENLKAEGECQTSGDP